MLQYLPYGILLMILSSSAVVAKENLKADLYFQTIPTIGSITNGNCNSPVLATYTIKAGTPTPITLQNIALEQHNDDTVEPNAVEIVPSTTKSCVINEKLYPNDTCNITVSFKPCKAGTISRTLFIDVNTSMGRLKSYINVNVGKILLQVVAGNNGPTEDPLIINSTDDGNTWNNVTNNVPSPPNVIFSGAACNLIDTCILVGQNKTNNVFSPLLITTLDSGVSWNNVTSLDQGTFPAMGQLYSTSCTDNNCIAVGFDQTNDGPFIVYSTNAGINWSQGSINNITQGDLFAASCNNTFCVAVGAGAPSPLLIYSRSGGNTWTAVTTLDDGSIPLPSNLYFSDAVSCSNNICIAGGQIPGSGFPPTSTPFLIGTTDGSSWNQVTSVGNGGLPASGVFENYACSGMNCVAVGHNDTDNGLLIVNTTDGGQTWNLISNLADSSPLPTGFISQVSCSGNNCVIGGEGNTPHIILLNSTDGGNSWNQVQSASGVGGLPNYGAVNALSCTHNICSAGGGDGIDNPFLLTSLDSGVTWTNITSTIADVAVGGEINAISISR